MESLSLTCCTVSAIAPLCLFGPAKTKGRALLGLGATITHDDGHDQADDYCRNTDHEKLKLLFVHTENKRYEPRDEDYDRSIGHDTLLFETHLFLQYGPSKTK